MYDRVNVRDHSSYVDINEQIFGQNNLHIIND